MRLDELIADLPIDKVVGDINKNVDFLSCKTDKIKCNTMFFCIVGKKIDGHVFAQKVALEGANVLVTERQLDLSNEVTQVIVKDCRTFMSLCAKNFYKCACDKLKIIGITGTNGKTSTTFILKSILENCGYNVGVIGTNGVWINDKCYPSQLTTPDPIELYEWFYKMVLSGVEYVVMEVSAHAIYLNKIEGINFEIGVFTNFSWDHLDFFKDIQEYSDTKISFFNKKYCKVAVVNGDDEIGQKIVAQNKLPIVTYGLNTPTDIFAIDEQATEDGIKYTINLCDEVAKVNYELKGKFNIYNTLCASAVARILGINIEKIAQGISRVKCVDGRSEIYVIKNGARVVVDFAHTPQGFANMLSYLKQTTKGKLICVFGCGGSRDKFKRPLIAKEVSTYCDFAIITNDNPRYENPQDIIKDVLYGMSISYDVVEDRRSAILQAIHTSCGMDTIAILGKGAERYQEQNGRRYPFSDAEIVKSFQ